MRVEQSRINNLQRPLLVQRPGQASLPQLDEHYFDKLAAFGLACLAAGIVGKLVVESLRKRNSLG